MDRQTDGYGAPLRLVFSRVFLGGSGIDSVFFGVRGRYDSNLNMRSIAATS
jgi:hypothetical protein